MAASLLHLLAQAALASSTAFTPGDLVALGPFQKTENAPSLSLQVDPHVFEIVKSQKGKIKIAYRDSAGKVAFLNATRIDETSGAVNLVNARAGRYVVVSESIANEFPIVTHWKQALNKGRGGREIGGTDAVGGMDGSDSTEFYSTRFYDNDPKSPYLWSQKNALFSSDSNAPNAALPDYERYPGEDYSLFGLSTNWAKGFSLRLAINTGFSARHLNGRGSCRAADVIPEAPFFQVVHACPIGQGDKMSLATLVIPPHWSPVGRYPVLFYPDRDLHYSFHQYGELIGKSIGDQINSGKGSAIGVVWNAGAAYGSPGLQRSMYDNTSQLFDFLSTSFSADANKIITVGCSRGGSEALAIAGNPYPRSYKVKEVLAYSPDVAFGTRYSQFISPTYPGMIYNRGIFTGYKYAWREGWRENQTGYRGWEVILKNAFGTADPVQADQHSPISEEFLRGTKDAGTRINLSIDTHDQFMPFANYIAYVNKAKSYGIPMRVRINYGGTHCGNMNMYDDLVDALARVNTGEETFSSEIEYYRPPRTLKELDEKKFPRIDAGQQPVAIELPGYVIPNGTFLYSVSGGSGVYFKLEVFKKNGTLPALNFSGRLPPMDPGARLHISTYTERLYWPATVPVGSYYYKLSYSVDNIEWKYAPYVPGNFLPVGQAGLTVMAEEPTASSADLCRKMPEVVKYIGCRDRRPERGWGLLSH
jgi:hypothetical protein